MNRVSCIRGIATLIANYRNGELPISLDYTHVERWVNQFPADSQETILYETFYVLTRNYNSIEAIESYITDVLEQAIEDYGQDGFELLLVQDCGSSQKEFIRILNVVCQQKYNKIIPIWNGEGECRHFIYLDDGLYTGKHFYSDMTKALPTLPEGSVVQACFMWAYDFGASYYANKLREQFDNITLKCSGNKHYHNKRDELNTPLDIIWPRQSLDYSKDVNQYYTERRMSALQYDYSWKPENATIEIFSCENNAEVVAKAFLEAGVEIQKRVRHQSFQPLGFTNSPYDFGFGSFVASDLNISNTCPLALWWGDVENPEQWGWYPLLPRRDNQTLLENAAVEEAKFSIENYKDILATVLDLAIDYFSDDDGEEREETSDILDSLEIWLKKRNNCDLLKYLMQQNFDTVKIVQTVMYIGRDYPLYPPEGIGDVDVEDWPHSPLVPNPNAVVLDWMNDIEYSSGWKTKEIEINQIIGKSPLPQYLTRGMTILGLAK